MSFLSQSSSSILSSRPLIFQFLVGVGRRHGADLEGDLQGFVPGQSSTGRVELIFKALSQDRVQQLVVLEALPPRWLPTTSSLHFRALCACAAC